MSAHAASAVMPSIRRDPRPSVSEGRDAVAVQERDLTGDGDFLDAGEVVYYHSNTLASVMALTDASENVVERYRYDAYGAATVLDADGSADADGLSDVANPYTYTARRLDVESGLLQYRNRYMDPRLGRFISRDPEGYADSYGLYAYVACQPTAASDPLGELLHTLGVICVLHTYYGVTGTGNPRHAEVHYSHKYVVCQVNPYPYGLPSGSPGDQGGPPPWHDVPGSGHPGDDYRPRPPGGHWDEPYYPPEGQDPGGCNNPEGDRASTAFFLTFAFCVPIGWGRFLKHRCKRKGQ